MYSVFPHKGQVKEVGNLSWCLIAICGDLNPSPTSPGGPGVIPLSFDMGPAPQSVMLKKTAQAGLELRVMGETGRGSFFLGFDTSFFQLFLANSSQGKEGCRQEGMLETCGNHLSSLPFVRLCQSHLSTGETSTCPH